ncbi:MAG: amidophosphoribosyltransferase [Saprospiraceae bacterium]|nr:amidophosphoribosyltransferase [Saprospiraceae bacterium]
MSDQIKHECGLAFVRLLKPLEYYHDKYGTVFYGLQKLQILLQKQRNRGQDGAGLASIKLNTQPGQKYFSVHKSNANNYITHLFEGVYSNFKNLDKEQLEDVLWLKRNKPFIGEIYLGHLRYGTHGDNSLETVHPFIRENNWISRNLAVAGNFNLTNIDELFDKLVSLGQFPKVKSDTITVLEKIGHFLDEEVQHLFNWYKPEGYSQQEINPQIFNNLDVNRVLKKAAKKFDGGFVIAGLLGHGDAFILRDPNGIRPAFYYQDEEVVVMASERPAIQTAFGVRRVDVHEIKPGNALIIKHHGKVTEEHCLEPGNKLSCSFERIYFSRGNDYDIYQERKNLGKNLVPQLISSIEYNLTDTVFSYIPNTSETCFHGLMEGITDFLNDQKFTKIQNTDPSNCDEIKKIINQAPRFEKLVLKDDKMRTFIANDSLRETMVSHVYDVTYGIVKNHVDTLAVVDDSIVRGTTLRDSIIRILNTLKPKKIIVLSSAPQIRYPDCYGIDMSQIDKLVAFQAAIELLQERNMESLMEEVYQQCLDQRNLPTHQMKNYVKRLYDQFTYEEITDKISKLLTPSEIRIPVEIIFQTLEGLHSACPNHKGDWYFSGNYPTPGGYKVLNNAYINFMEKNDVRAY